MANHKVLNATGDDALRAILLPCMADMDMEPLDSDDPEAALVPKREGALYRMPTAVALGYYWVFADEDFAVSVTDLAFHEDYRETCPHPRFVAVRYYTSGFIEERLTGHSHRGAFLEGHVRRNERWDALIHASEPVRNVEIMLTPRFYEHFLRDAYSHEALDAEAAFASIDGVPEFPELIVVLKQLEAYRGRGASARLYYRSKVTEAVALIVEKSRALAATGAPESHTPRAEPTTDDAQALARVAAHLDEHAFERVDAATLARIACMGQSKLRAAFKRAFGCTVTAYVQRRRMAEAARLLVVSDATLAQVARAVGYRSAERFKELFEREQGCSPAAYRRSFAAPASRHPAASRHRVMKSR